MDGVHHLAAKFKTARGFYIVVLISTIVGIGFNYAGVDPVRALFWSAVVNGLLAPLLLVAVLLVATDRKLMKGQQSSPLATFCVALPRCSCSGPRSVCSSFDVGG